jgi:hypothetical protein
MIVNVDTGGLTAFNGATLMYELLCVMTAREG